MAIMNGGSSASMTWCNPGQSPSTTCSGFSPMAEASTRVDGGALLRSVLETGLTNRGTGGYLHTRGATREGSRWMIAGKPLDVSARYRLR